MYCVTRLHLTVCTFASVRYSNERSGVSIKKESETCDSLSVLCALQAVI